MYIAADRAAFFRFLAVKKYSMLLCSAIMLLLCFVGCQAVLSWAGDIVSCSECPCAGLFSRNCVSIHVTEEDIDPQGRLLNATAIPWKPYATVGLEAQSMGICNVCVMSWQLDKVFVGCKVPINQAQLCLAHAVDDAQYHVTLRLT